MSKVIQYPNGLTGPVSDKVAEILLQRKGHSLVADKPAPVIEPEPETKKAKK